MSYQNIGLTLSLLLHLLLVPFLFYINKPVSQESEAIALSFELDSILIKGEQDADEKVTDTIEKDSNPAKKEQETERVVDENPHEKVIKVAKEEVLSPAEDVQEFKEVVEEEVPLPEKKVEIIKKVETASVYTKSVTKPVVVERQDELLDSAKLETDSQDVAQKRVSQYIRKHFDYINKLIRLNISYPGRALRRSMEGTVIASFVVKLDGSIKDINVKQSSGYSILDNNVVKAVKKAAPFPKPQVEVKVIIPITFRLGS